MIVEIDTEKLRKHGLDFHQYLFCQFIYQQAKPDLSQYLSVFGAFFDNDSLNMIRSLGYLDLKNEKDEYRFNNIFVTDLFVEDFIEKSVPSKLISNKLSDWFDDWFNLFPQGVKSGGYLVKSDKAGCLKKMEKFVKLYPEYNKDIIIRATKDYINYMRMKQFQYMQLAHYFILKNDVSTLASCCEDVKNKLDTNEIEDLEVDYTIDKFTKKLN